MLKGGKIIYVDGTRQPLVPCIKVHAVKPLHQFVTSENFKRAIHFVNNTVGGWTDSSINALLASQT